MLAAGFLTPYQRNTNIVMSPTNTKSKHCSRSATNEKQPRCKATQEALRVSA